MGSEQIVWPKKTREQQWAVWDSARLNDFAFRKDDIVICTWSKTGTTLVQQIVAQLIFKGDPDIYGQQISPWPEFRPLPKEQWFAIAEAQKHRRFIKTHSPIDAVPYLPHVRYIYVGRDVRDVIWSMYHHHTSFTREAYNIFNNTPGRVGPPIAPHNMDVRAYYHHFLDAGHPPGFAPYVDFWPHVQGAWNIRHVPNLLLVHYANLKADLRGEIERIAHFLDVDVADALWPRVLKHCSLEHMRELASRSEMLDQMFEGGGRTFINKGTNGRWRDVLSAEEIAKADETAARNLSPDCAHWLETGERLA
jgi:aryl sulfotransferase